MDDQLTPDAADNENLPVIRKPDEAIVLPASTGDAVYNETGAADNASEATAENSTAIVPANSLEIAATGQDETAIDPAAAPHEAPIVLEGEVLSPVKSGSETGLDNPDTLNQESSSKEPITLDGIKDRQNEFQRELAGTTMDGQEAGGGAIPPGNVPPSPPSAGMAEESEEDFEDDEVPDEGTIHAGEEESNEPPVQPTAEAPTVPPLPVPVNPAANGGPPPLPNYDYLNNPPPDDERQAGPQGEGETPNEDEDETRQRQRQAAQAEDHLLGWRMQACGLHIDQHRSTHVISHSASGTHLVTKAGAHVHVTGNVVRVTGLRLGKNKIDDAAMKGAILIAAQQNKGIISVKGQSKKFQRYAVAYARAGGIHIQTDLGPSEEYRIKKIAEGVSFSGLHSYSDYVAAQKAAAVADWEAIKAERERTTGRPWHESGRQRVPNNYDRANRQEPQRPDTGSQNGQRAQQTPGV